MFGHPALLRVVAPVPWHKRTVNPILAQHRFENSRVQLRPLCRHQTLINNLYRVGSLATRIVHARSWRNRGDWRALPGA